MYKKAGWRWGAGIIGFLGELNIPYEIKNVTSNPAYGEELKAASGQWVSPSLDIDGTMLADASVEDVAKMLEERGLIILEHKRQPERSGVSAIVAVTETSVRLPYLRRRSHHPILSSTASIDGPRLEWSEIWALRVSDCETRAEPYRLHR